MRPAKPLPVDSSWASTDEYVKSLLTFVSTNELFRNLCGGVHVLDFLTRKPDLYSWILPEEWRDWFDEVGIEDVLDLLLREDMIQFRAESTEPGTPGKQQWRSYSVPPRSLVEYVRAIRMHSLKRDFKRRSTTLKHDLEALPRHVAVGMKPKKIHEVTQFAAFVDDLSQHLTADNTDSSDGAATEDKNGDAHVADLEATKHKDIQLTVVDFGSGQNYLGRTLACPPYNKNVVAIEQRHHNVEGARGMDVSARLAKRAKRMINKKEWKAQWEAKKKVHKPCQPDVADIVTGHNDVAKEELQDMESRIPQLSLGDLEQGLGKTDRKTRHTLAERVHDSPPSSTKTASINGSHDHVQDQSSEQASGTGAIQYVEKELSSGDLSDVLDASSSHSLVVSIHSCGNLTHHGLRSITLNSSVRAVALIGCCYNLLSERLGPPTYKLPTLRSNHPRLEATSSAFDPHGFPMSRTLEDFTYPLATGSAHGCHKVYNLNGELQPYDTTGRGVRLNITARMMAVQAPHNWGPKESEDFFTRHFYRALLQRILLDLGVVKMAKSDSVEDVEIAGGTLSGKDDAGTPLIIGTLNKSCFTSFRAYVAGAIVKLTADPVDGLSIREKTNCLFEDDGQLINQYEKDYQYAKKQLSVIWSLMAFSASVVESTILVDRWLWLEEQDEVKDAWIEPVFDYKLSPRNMVVVGLKRSLPDMSDAVE